MPPGIGYPPGTMPGNLKRRPFDLSKLPPEMQQRLAAEGQIAFEDGSTVYADGTSEGAGDSPDDFAMGMGGAPGYDYGGGGYANALGMGGPPATLPEELSDPADPLAGPLYKRYRQTANAPFPGTPGGVGGGPLPGENPALAPNPTDEPLPNPFEPAETAESPMAHVPSLPPSATPPAFATKGTEEKGGGYQGRLGRRMQERQTTRTRRRRR